MKSNILLDECKSAIFLLKLLGLFPLQVDSAKKFKFKFFIVPVTYFITFYTFSMYIATKQMVRRIFILSLKVCNFDCLIFSLATLIALVPTMLIPIAFWLNIKHTILFWDSCHDFQIRYENLVGISIKIKVKQFMTFFVITSVMVVLLVTTLPSIFIAKTNFNFFATSTYYVVFSGFIAGISYWLSVCLFLKQVACNVLQFIQECFQKFFIEEYRIEICYELWSSVQSLLKQFGRSMEFFLLIYGFTLILTMLNSMYGFISQLYTTELKRENIKHAIGHFIIFLWSSTLMFIINESSYQVVDTFTYKFKQQIFLINLNNRSASTKNQITEFYQIFRNIDSKLSFSGFNEFSRTFFIAVLGAIITYMVILLQIRNDYLLSQKQMSTVNMCSNFTA